MSKLTIVCWLWKSSAWRHGKYSAEHVNTLHNMVSANLKMPHRFVCVTDMPEGIDCETIPLWTPPPVKTMPNKPNCYVRLKAFSEEIREHFGDRFVSMDIDALVVDALDPLFDHDDDFRILKGYAAPYNGSMWMMTTGARKRIWDDFNPQRSPELAARGRDGKQRYYGSDQAWISYNLENEKVWTQDDGVLQYWRNYSPESARMPEGARLIFFAGQYNPWDDMIKRKHPLIHKLYNAYK